MDGLEKRGTHFLFKFRYLFCSQVARHFDQMRQTLTAMPRHNATLLIVPNNIYMVIENQVLYFMYFIHPLCRFRRLVKKCFGDLLNITI